MLYLAKIIWSLMGIVKVISTSAIQAPRGSNTNPSFQWGVTQKYQTLQSFYYYYWLYFPFKIDS